MADQITISPDPVERGKAATIHYNGTNPQTLTVTWFPGGSSTVTTDADGNVTVTAPDNADTVKVTGGTAPGLSTIVI